MENRTEKQRESNLELFRIITMLLIIAHHSIVNSGLLSGGGPVRSDPQSFRSFFALAFGAWGKTGINCFVLISGYYMCRSKITLRKFLKLFLEWMFYRLLIYGFFCAVGYEIFTWSNFLNELIPITSIASNFVPCYIVFFLCIPFLNLLTGHMNERQHLLLILIGCFVYTALGTFRAVKMNYVSWFIVLYFIASYIRLYPRPLYGSLRFWGIALCCSVVLSLLSIVVTTRIRGRFGINEYHYFLSDSNTLLALTNGVCAFLFFKNLPVRQSRVINAFGASTFGVLLIHSVGSVMRRFLWTDVFKIVQAYSYPLFIPYMIGVILLIFLVCSLIDMLRIRLIEKPLFALYDRHEAALTGKLRSVWENICKKTKTGEP